MTGRQKEPEAAKPAIITGPARLSTVSAVLLLRPICGTPRDDDLRKPYITSTMFQSGIDPVRNPPGRDTPYEEGRICRGGSSVRVKKGIHDASYVLDGAPEIKQRCVRLCMRSI